MIFAHAVEAMKSGAKVSRPAPNQTVYELQPKCVPVVTEPGGRITYNRFVVLANHKLNYDTVFVIGAPCEFSDEDMQATDWELIT